MIDTTISHSGTLSDNVVRQTLLHAAIGVAWLHADGRIISVNPRLASWMGSSVDRIIGTHLGRYVPKLDASHWHTLWSQLGNSPISEPRAQFIVNREVRQLDMLIQRLPGNGSDIAVVYLNEVQNPLQQNALHNLQAEVLEAVALGKPLAESMALLCQRVEVLAPDVLCTVLRVDEHGRVHPLAASTSMPAEFGRAIDNKPIGPKAGSCGTAAYRGEPVEVLDIASDPLWEDYRAVALPLGLKACWSSPIKSRDGRVTGTFALYYREPRGSSLFHRQLVNACVHLCSLAIEHHETEQRIHQLAFFDPLTQLPNRALLRERARHELFHAAREKKNLAVFFFDLDRFKTVNDSLGHQIGDHLLQHISQRLLQTIRESDTVSRLGGDEFVLLLPNCGPEHAHLLAEKLLVAISEPLAINHHVFTPTASIGIGIFPRDGVDFDDLLKNTDAAMYHAKAAGRNTFRFFRPEMNTAANEYLELEAALRHALKHGEISVHFQPKIRLTDQKLLGVEALARWQHPQRGNVPPASFIPLAEECGLITQLDHHILRSTCQQIAHWRQQGIPVPTVAVNLSPVNFRDAGLAEKIVAVLQEFSVPPECLILEITESLMMQGADNILTTLHTLRAAGIGLALDDFGTGFSSLSYLTRFPVTELKLDQSFVRALHEDEDSRTLASAIVSIGRQLDMKVVAEGVETAIQLKFLQDEGCHVAQGFYFAKPVSADELEQWLLQR